MGCHRIFLQTTTNYTSTVDSMTQSLRETMLACVFDIGQWMSSNRLRLSPSKTEFLWCAISRCIHQIDDSSFHVGDVDVKPSQAVRNFGVLMDGDL